MILLLGGSGYIGQAFVRELTRRQWPFRNVSRQDCDYCQFGKLHGLLSDLRPEFLINCAGFTGKPNVDACESAREDTLAGNALLPHTIAHTCEVAGVPWGHVSSGCIYAGAKVLGPGGQWTVERDLMLPEVRGAILADRSLVAGFTESDPANFSFQSPPCSFYSGTKALAERALVGAPRTYIWRLRIPFDEQDSPRNYLSKIQRYAKVYDNFNSLSHRGDFVRACLDGWQQRIPFGTYNLTNPGWVTTREVVDLLSKELCRGRQFEFWDNDAAFYGFATAPRSNCILSTEKLQDAGVRVRPVWEALEEAVREWKV